MNYFPISRSGICLCVLAVVFQCGTERARVLAKDFGQLPTKLRDSTSVRKLAEWYYASDDDFESTKDNWSQHGVDLSVPIQHSVRTATRLGGGKDHPVIIPNHVCHIHGSISLASNIHIVCDGYGERDNAQAVLRITDEANKDPFLNLAGCSNCVIKGIRFDGRYVSTDNKTTRYQEADIISLGGANTSSISFFDCIFSTTVPEGQFDCLRIGKAKPESSVRDINFYRCRIADGGRYNLSVGSNAESIYFEECVFAGEYFEWNVDIEHDSAAGVKFAKCRFNASKKADGNITIGGGHHNGIRFDGGVIESPGIRVVGHREDHVQSLIIRGTTINGDLMAWTTHGKDDIGFVRKLDIRNATISGTLSANCLGESYVRDVTARGVNVGMLDMHSDDWTNVRLSSGEQVLRVGHQVHKIKH